jgi:hypothetical protein
MSFLGIIFVPAFLLVAFSFLRRDLGSERTNKLMFGLFRDPSAWSLLLSNLVTIVYFTTGRVQVGEVFFIYWGQGIIITILTIVWVLFDRNYSTDELFNHPPSPTFSTKVNGVLTASIFFGLFYSFYGWALFSMSGISSFSAIFNATKIPLLFFLVNHIFSFVYNRANSGSSEKVKVTEVLFEPFNRVLPMHLIIMFGNFFNFFGALSAGVLFLGLKTGTDLVLHGMKHYRLK